MHYVTIQGDLAPVAKKYKYQAHVVCAAGAWWSDIFEAEVLPNLPPPPEGVLWQLQGHTQPVTGGAPQLGLHLQAQGALQLQCQHCLAPVRETVQALKVHAHVQAHVQTQLAPAPPPGR